MNRFKKYAIADTFGIQAPATAQVTGFEMPGEMTPPSNKNYRFRKSLLLELLGWIRANQSGHKDGLWLSGPMGAGKSSAIIEVASRLNLNIVQTNGKRRLEIADLIGHHTVVNGDVQFLDGPLTTAMRNGWLLLMNEIDLIDPGELAGLNTVLDGGPLVIAENGGEVVYPQPGFGIIATANTVGMGDSAGLYLGTQRMNGAFMDRFWVIEVDYPEADIETAILMQAVTDIPSPVITNMVQVANEVRRLFRGDNDEGTQIETTFSTRTLLRWAYLARQYRNAPQPMLYALKRALTNRAEPETAAAIEGIAKRVLG